jgi:hypothetical protein
MIDIRSSAANNNSLAGIINRAHPTAPTSMTNRKDTKDKQPMLRPILTLSVPMAFIFIPLVIILAVAYWVGAS